MLETLDQLYDETLSHLKLSQQNWKDYLKFYSKIHKYPFNQACLVYAQNPDVEMIATSEVWKRVGRNVLPESKAIMVVKYDGGREDINYLFDISQTSGQKIRRPDWTIQEYERESISKLLPGNDVLESKLDNFTENVAAQVFDEYPDVSSQKDFDWPFAMCAAASAQLVVHEKLGLGNFTASYSRYLKLVEFQSIEKICDLGFLTTEISKKVLGTVASWKKTIENERMTIDAGSQSELYQRRGRDSLPESEIEQESRSRGDSAWDLRENGIDASPGDESSPIYETSDGGNHQGKDVASRERVEREGYSADESNEGIKSSTENREPTSKGTVSESTEKQSGGDHIGRSRPVTEPKLQLNQLEEPDSVNEPGSFSSSEQRKESSVQLDLFNDWDSIGEDIEGEGDSLTEGFSQKQIDEILMSGSRKFIEKQRLEIEDGQNGFQELNAEINDSQIIQKDDVSVESEVIPTTNYHYDASDNLYANGEKTKYKNNVAAIRLLKELESSSKPATIDQQRVLARYVGWGGLANVFSNNPGKWEREQQELKMLLTDQEYQEAMESTLTAYYTDQDLIGKIYKGIEKLGFKSGDILDPAMGTGNFFSVLPEGMRNSSLTGVELDNITGRIAKQLYPLADIQIKGFEDTSFEDNSFDVVVGNIPFANLSIEDERYKDHSFLIHDYFIAHSLDVVKPGGIVAVITSKGTLDKKDTSVREYIAERAKLLAAIRLPNTAFKVIAGTEVTADILFLQKLEKRRDIKDERPSWLELESLPNSIASVNGYFIQHPDMMLGRMDYEGFYNGSQQWACVPEDGHDLSSDLKEAINKIQGSFSARPTKRKQSEENELEEEIIDAPRGLRNFTYTVQNNQLYYCENEKLVPQTFSNSKTERIKGLCHIREALLDVINLQTNGEYDQEELKKKQKLLNDRYDTFVTKYGYINETANLNAFFEDNQLPLLQSIENTTDGKSFTKAAIFERATIRPIELKRNAESAQEALGMSLNNKTGVDFEYMSSIYHKNPEEIRNELGDLVYLNPIKFTGDMTKGWETKDEYLSGNVYDKLEYARTMSKENPIFQRNVTALEEVQPVRLLPGDISYRIGSPWIPIKYYQQFMYELLDTEKWNRIGSGAITISYSKYTNTWRISAKRSEPDNIKVNTVYGTGRMNAYELFEASLNLQDVTIRDPVPYFDDNGKQQIKYVLNPKETMIARQKQQDIQSAFQSWLFKDPERSEDLLDIYNNTFNRFVPRAYDGSHLTFPGMSEEVSLRPHQKNLVERIMETGTALAAHETGAGKTASLIAAGMKLRQIGAVKKPMYVVMNHTIEQWKKEFLRFYPGANVLVATKKDFEKKNRQRFVSKIATGDYDAIIIGHSQFERIPISEKRQKAILKREISTLAYEIEMAKKEDGNNWSVKQLVSFKKKLNVRLEKLANRSKKDDVIDFEQLGVDALFVDEAHVFKNLFTVTKMKNVAGIGMTSSQRASDLKMKTEYIQEEHNGRGVVFATATPVSNSMSELFVMQSYLQPEELKRSGLHFFDNWAGTFGEVVTSLEMTPEGGGYRMKSRFAKFHNVPELMSMFHLVADIQTSDMLDLPVPELIDGKAKVIVSQPSEYQKEMMDDFVLRSEMIRNGDVNPTEDNMLKLTHEARLMAIDPRLIDELAPIPQDSKINMCVDNVLDIWKKTRDKRATQMIFCDSGTPKPDRFNVYDEIKSQLIKKGIPESEIVFIHDAKNDRQRDKMFAKMRKGDIRVLLGSTSKVGTGTNVQDKLIAGHHIDCPWKPADIEQRDGRIIRQGNSNDKVSIFHYVTKGTFDGYLWQIQEQKLRYISQVMTSKNISRTMNDLDETVLSAAEVKAIATDNPLLLEKMTLDNEVNRLHLIRSRWSNEQAIMQRRVVKTFPARIAEKEKEIDKLKKDMKTVASFKGRPFLMTVDGVNHADKREAGEHIAELLKTIPYEDHDPHDVGSFKGLETYIIRDAFGNTAIGLRGETIHEVAFMKAEKANIERMEGIIGMYPSFVKEAEKNIAIIRDQLKKTKAQLHVPFEHEQKLNSLKKKQAEMNLKLEFKQNGPLENKKEKNKEEARTR